MSPFLLQLGLDSGNPLVSLLAVVVAIGLVVLVGRIVLKVAWRLVTIAAVIIGLIVLVTTFLPSLL
jgi:divalent metal cation (Fe/Co/Zn/Cd) transporter